MKRFFMLIAITGSLGANSQKLSFSGENYLVLDGERFKNQKIVFENASGDWFATNNDSHGNIDMNAMVSGVKMNLEMEWDGKDQVHIITDEIRHQQRKGEFVITSPDKDTYGDGVLAYPIGEQEIKIIIHSSDDMKVSGEITGVVTQGRDKVKVSGFFNLNKPAGAASLKKIITSSYKDCDNVVHDKLIGAEGRSPSECEAKYDLDIRTIIHDAVSSVIEDFKKKGWEIEDETDLKPLIIVARGSEKDIFNTTYEIKLSASPSSAIYDSYQKQYADVSDKLKNATKESYDDFVKFLYKMNGAIKIFIRFSVNTHNSGFGNFKGESKLTKIDDHTFKMESNYVQSRNGGDETASSDGSFLFIGNWKQPRIEKESDGSETVNAVATLNPALPHLQAQNIFIRMECNAELANEIIKNLDLRKLESLLNH